MNLKKEIQKKSRKINHKKSSKSFLPADIQDNVFGGGEVGIIF